MSSGYKSGSEDSDPDDPGPLPKKQAIMNDLVFEDLYPPVSPSSPCSAGQGISFQELSLQGKDFKFSGDK